MRKRFFVTVPLFGAAGLYALRKRGDRDLEKKRTIERVRTGMLEYREPETEDYYTVFPDFTKLDYNFAQRFNIFQSYMTHNYNQSFGLLQKEYDSQGNLITAADQPDVLPVKLKPGIDPKSFKNIDWANLNPSDKKRIAQNFESIKARRVSYKKPIAIIYNPNSGKKRQIKSIIEDRLKAAEIPYEMMPTQKEFDTFEFAYSLDMNKYSAILAVGGDGSYFEVVNGMLMRTDGKRLPIGVVPNGSGNTVGYLLGIESVNEAMDTVVAATASKFDLARVLADTEHESDVRPGRAGYDQRRYGLCIVAGGWGPDLIKFAIPLKPFFGSMAYDLSFLRMMVLRRPLYQYDAEIDGQKWPNQEGEKHSIVTDAFDFYSGKFVGYYNMSPYSSLNDGLVEIEFDTKVKSVFSLLKMLSLAEQGGLQLFEPKDSQGRGRGKRIKLTYQGVKGQPKQKGEKAAIIIDGEPFEFENTLVLESVPEGVEYLFDHEQYFKDYKIIKE